MRVSTDGNSQLDRLMDTLASSIWYTYDAYGWIVPAIFLTLLFFAAVVLLCWLADVIPLEGEILTAPHSIFNCMRKRWQTKANG
jgi:hypothetical protein